MNMVEVIRVEPRGPESRACFVKKGAFCAIFSEIASELNLSS
jgi:hypothetical protein